MSTPEDNLQFEIDLRQFRPRSAPPFLAQRKPSRIRLRRMPWKMLVAAAVIVVVVATTVYDWHLCTRRKIEAQQQKPLYDMTLGHAQVVMAHSSSPEEAIHELERESMSELHKKPKPGERVISAFEVLGREKL